MTKDSLLVYTDGACSGNPGPGGWGAIVMTPEGRVRELGAGERQTTNNRMEISAAIAALRFAQDLPGPVALFTDSTYLISGITRWIKGWKRNGWIRKDGGQTLNRDLWTELDELNSRRTVAWNYVRGHQGHPGNCRCDEIAVAFSKSQPPKLYDGPLLEYSVDLFPPKPEALPAGPRDPRSHRPAGAKKGGWYLSLLDGRLEKHQTWPECQARVHGKPALFKKVSSSEEEAAALKKWGLA